MEEGPAEPSKSWLGRGFIKDAIGACLILWAIAEALDDEFAYAALIGGLGALALVNWRKVHDRVSGPNDED